MSTAYPTTRYRCDYCPRNYSARGGATRHEAKCWKNPANRACLTCVHFDPGLYRDWICKLGMGTVRSMGHGDQIEDVTDIESNCTGWEMAPVIDLQARLG